jgi:hypothetical protein
MSTDKTPQSFNIQRALRTRYAAPEYSVYTEVTIGDRRADMVAIGLWASRGCPIVGIEIKESRSDWLRELRDPAKMEKLWRHCSSVYLAVSDPDIVKDDLPDGWGLLVPRGNSMVTKRRPAERTPETGKAFWVRLLQHDLESRSREVMAAVAEQRRSLVKALESEELTKLRNHVVRMEGQVKTMSDREDLALSTLHEIRSAQEWMQGLSEYEKGAALSAVKLLMKTHWWRSGRRGHNHIDELACTLTRELSRVANNISRFQDLVRGEHSCGSSGGMTCDAGSLYNNTKISDVE